MISGEIEESNTGTFLWICEIFKSIFFYRTPLVVASENIYVPTSVPESNHSHQHVQIEKKKREIWSKRWNLVKLAEKTLVDHDCRWRLYYYFEYFLHLLPVWTLSILFPGGMSFKS